MIDIFSVAEQPREGEFFKFTKIGDSVQGTFIDSYDTKDGYGNDQRVVVLKDGDKIWNIGIRKDTIWHEESLAMVLGEVVGFRFDRETPSKVRPGSMAKVINTYRDPAVVDQVWLEEREAKIRDINEQMGHIPDAAPQEAAPEEKASEPAAASEDPSIAAIRTLALTKGLTEEGQSTEEQDKIIQEFAKLEYSEDNNTKIIVALSSFGL